MTRPASQTTFARIIHAIEEAQATRAPSQQFVDRFARVYTPVVMTLAVLTATIPPLIPALSGGGDFHDWLYRGLVFLVISCPCALVISTPVAIVTALATAARHGVLIKGGIHLENLGRARVVSFDKTGTLTTGRTRVTEVIPLNGTARDHLLAAAAAIESRSEHPFARALRDQAEEEGLNPLTATEFQAMPGRGAQAIVEGELHLVGAPRLFEERSLLTTEGKATLTRLAEEGKSVILVGTLQGLEGAIALSDQPRAESAEVVRGLRRAGVEHTVMLTGDHPAAAAAIARQIGIDEVRASLLPEDKVVAIQELTGQHGTVVMVGDGINDAPALAAAGVGVAMGTGGTDIALETADVALVGDDLRRLPYALRLAQRTLRVIRLNITIALAAKLVFLVLTFFGLTTLWLAVLADMGASLFVTAHSLTIAKFAVPGDSGHHPTN